MKLNIMQIADLLFYSILIVMGNLKDFCCSKESFIKRIIRIHFKNIYNEFVVKDVISTGERRFARIGGNGDGAYVMYDDFDKSGIAYSLGIGDNADWDLAMAEKGFEIYMYDFSVSAPPIENEHFHFFMDRVGHGGKRLKQIINENGHTEEKNLILKMDIEASEWRLMKETDKETLKQFKQITAEIHFPFNLFHVYATPILKKINQTHQIVHIHANNVNNYDILAGIRFPMYLEVTWLRREDYTFEKNMREFPTELDKANISFKEDISLGRWNESISIKDRMPFNM